MAKLSKEIFYFGSLDCVWQNASSLYSRTGGRTLLTKHLLSCRRKVAYCGTWKESVFSFLLVSLALPFSPSPAVIIVICGAFLCFNPRHCDWHAHYSEASNADEEKNRLCWSGDKYSSLQLDALQSFQQRY